VISVLPVTGLPEIGPGDDLATLLVSAAGLRDRDLVVVTSKVVSKAEGRVVSGDRGEALDREADRFVARRGHTAIVRTRHGLVMAAAGIDASNTEPGTLVLLPKDPDASARRLREAIAVGGGLNVGVLVSDTSGRAWRTGQTDIAVGAAGVVVLDDHAGRDDGYGNLLAVTAPALADEITAAADLVTGKLSRSPAAVVRGLGDLVLPPGQHGPGAGALVRPEAQDMFGLGSREAVLESLLRREARGFGGPAAAYDVAEDLSRVAPEATVSVDAAGDRLEVVLPALGERALGALEERVRALAFALGWSPSGPHGESEAGRLRFAPTAP
jgi:coenzyme F420-0:L-glutamate ligase / coenzyme F420-1:gamma-L-glutamate ligase